MNEYFRSHNTSNETKHKLYQHEILYIQTNLRPNKTDKTTLTIIIRT